MNKKTDDLLTVTIPCNITVVTPPSLYLPSEGTKIFLAGSIGNGNTPDWQAEAINIFSMNIDEDYPTTLYNPRRPSGEFSPEDEDEQVAWTISMLVAADYILLHLTGDTGSPISTLELGMFINSPKLFLSIDDSYSRKEVIEVHYNHFGVGQIYNGLGEAIMAIEADMGMEFSEMNNK